eukprot:gene8035-8896_t
MDGRKRKRGYEYIEGHRRETRKSYQTFIESETVSTTKSNEARPSSPAKQQRKHPNEGESERVRKSSRTPVPKKSFDLVDTFETTKTRDYKDAGEKLAEDDTRVRCAKESLTTTIPKEETNEIDSDHFSRKSQRTPIPKKTFDLIDSGYGKLSSKNQQLDDSNQDDLSKKSSKKEEQEKVKKSSKSQGKVVSNKVGKQKSKKEKIVDDKNKKSNADEDVASQEITQKSNEKKTSAGKKAVEDKKKDVKDEKGRKSSRKRKHSDIVTSKDEECEDKIESKAVKTHNENLDESILAEALQALNAEPVENDQMIESTEEIQGKKEKKAGRSTKNITAAKSLQKTIQVKEEDKPIEEAKSKEVKSVILAEQERDDFPELVTKDELSLVKEEKDDPLQHSTTSVTERPDGHIILKLGGLSSPTKVKKHKKKHKHHHHHKHDKELKSVSNVAAMDEVTYVEDGHRMKAAMPFIGTERSVKNQERMAEKPGDSKGIRFFSESKTSANVEEAPKHKKSKKMKKSLSFEASSEDFTHSQNAQEFIIKKRKIYKKKKGQKILARIQTEYWSKSGVLLKVDPSDKKDKTSVSLKSKSNKVSMKQIQMGAVEKKVKAKKHHSSHLLAKHGHVLDKGSKIVPKDIVIRKEKSLEKLMESQTGLKKRMKPKMFSNAGGESNESSPVKKKKERKTQTLTAYLLYCRRFRPKILEENVGLGFCEISKKLAKMWGEAPEKEKDIYRKQLEEHRAKLNAKLRKQSSKLKTTKQTGALSPDKNSLGLPNLSKKSSKDYQIAPQKYNLSNLEPIDMAAHLQLLGESLTLVATALRRQGSMKVHGSLSVLLDSCLCSMAPLLFLTSSIPEIDVIPAEMKQDGLTREARVIQWNVVKPEGPGALNVHTGP